MHPSPILSYFSSQAATKARKVDNLLALTKIDRSVPLSAFPLSIKTEFATKNRFESERQHTLAWKRARALISFFIPFSDFLFS